MGIEIFEKTYEGNIAGTVQDLLHDAGFSDVTNTSADTINADFSSGSGVYGCKSFSIYNNNYSAEGKFVAVKDDSRKALIVFPTGFSFNNAARDYGYHFFTLMIVNGVACYRPDINPLSLFYNAVGGDIRSTTDTADVILLPFIDAYGHVFAPFFVSANNVNHAINTTVTDGVNSFTSLGNLFYIKNA